MLFNSLDVLSEYLCYIGMVKEQAFGRQRHISSGECVFGVGII